MYSNGERATTYQFILFAVLEIYMALSIMFLCYKTHKDPTQTGGCIKPYVFIGKITIIAKNHMFS